MAYINNIQIVT